MHAGLKTEVKPPHPAVERVRRFVWLKVQYRGRNIRSGQMAIQRADYNLDCLYN